MLRFVSQVMLYLSVAAYGLLNLTLIHSFCTMDIIMIIYNMGNGGRPCFMHWCFVPLEPIALVILIQDRMSLVEKWLATTLIGGAPLPRLKMSVALAYLVQHLYIVSPGVAFF